MTRPGKQQINAYLSFEASEALSSAAREAGVSTTGVIEALGQLLADDGIGPLWTRIVDLARDVDAERRRRERVAFGS